MKNPNRVRHNHTAESPKTQAPKPATKTGQGSATETQSAKRTPINWADLRPCVKRLFLKIQQLPEPTKQRVIALMDSLIQVRESAEKLGFSLDITYHSLAARVPTTTTAALAGKAVQS